MSYSYEYPRAALTVDCVVFGLDDDDLKVLLIQRNLPPFEGRWALPGGLFELTSRSKNPRVVSFGKKQALKMCT